MEQRLIDEAAARIRSGGLVAFPTETVYGLGANALDPLAVRRIYAAKGRPATSPLIVHVSSVEMARDYAAEWPHAADELTLRHWPGPLTIVLKKRPAIPAEVTSGLDTVGLRMPAHPVALSLIEAAGVPIAAPSANRFTGLSPTTADHVRRAFGPEVLVLDGGSTPVGIESTVVSLVGEPVLLRPGMISSQELERVLGPLKTLGEASGAHPSPGLHRKHYSPRTPLVLGAAPASGHGAIVRVGENAAAFAASLYATLHELDQRGLDWIVVEEPPAGPEWEGIRDRLQRAAHTG